MLIRSKPLRVFSSVGLERYLDRVEVGGSNPSTPTFLTSPQWWGFIIISFIIFFKFSLKYKQ